MIRFFLDTKIEGILTCVQMLKFPAQIIAMVPVVVFCISCNTPEIEKDNGENTEVSTFSQYKDTLVNLKQLNTGLNTNFNAQSLGKPIGISGTTQWLITVGGWKLKDRNILLQGNSFKEGNDFFPNPMRNTEVEFIGPFSGLIRYNAQSNEYDWLIEPDQELPILKYQRTSEHHLVVLAESKTSIKFVEVGSNTHFSVEPSQEILEWSVNGVGDEIVLLIGPNDSATLKKFAIAELLNKTVHE